MSDWSSRCSDPEITSQLVNALIGGPVPSSPLFCSSRGSVKSVWSFSGCPGYLPSVSISTTSGRGPVDGPAKLTYASANATTRIGPCAGQCRTAQPAGGGAVTATFAATGPDSEGITLIVVNFIQKMAIPVIVNTVFQSTRSAITVNATLSSPGSLYCAPFAPSEVPSSVDSVILRGVMGSGSVASGRSISLVLNGLQASTDYSVYCLAASRDGGRMGYSDMLASKQQAATSCCKYIFVELLLASVQNGMHYHETM